MKVRILLYRTPWKLKFKYFFNWLISIRTLSKWSHVEIWTPDENGRFTMAPNNSSMDYWGTCWTSTMRDDDNGTVKRDASKVLIHPENWDYIEIEVPEYDAMIGYMNQEVSNNKGYAKWDILKFVSPLHFPDNDRNICSEIVNDALWYGGVFTKGGIVSPEEVCQKLIDLGHEVKSLVNQDQIKEQDSE